jgi:hypothetical protein
VRVGYPATVTIYSEDDGRIVGILTTTEDLIEKNIPPGCSYVPGAHDARNRRINTISKAVEAYQPPQDDPDAVWDAAKELWEIPASIFAARVDKADMTRRIEALERTQLRALRELALDIDPILNRAKLKAIDDAIVELRNQFLP